MELGNTRLYITKDAKSWQDKVYRNYENISTCNFVEVKNGYILPLKRLPSEPNVSTNGVYVGGVQSENGKFVAGHRRHKDDNFNLSCSSTYMIDEQLCKEIIVSDETVIYGGVIIDIFGHVLSEAFSRLWYILEHNYGYRIAFCHRGSEIPNYFYEFMKLLGISSEQILIIDKPIRFKNIIVPDQACANYIGYHSKVSDIYITMMETAQKILSITNLNEFSQRKIYLSRAQFVKDGNNDCINESYFEEFFKRRGYEIISPESLSISEQVALISTASEVVCTGGTLSHLLLFAKNGTKLTILLRCNEANALIPQFIINQMKHLDVCIVDCSYNYLPTTHAGGVFLMEPTKDFINYLEHEKIAFLPEEVQMDFEQTAWPYISSWINNYSRNWYPYKRINKQDIFDVVNRMSEVLLNKPLTRKQMATPIKSNVSQIEFNEIKDYCENIKSFAGQYYIYKHVYQVLKKTISEIETLSSLENSEHALQKYVERAFLTYDVHFSKSGWINANGEYALVGATHSDRRIEAIRINIYSQDADIEYGVYVDKVGWKNGKNGQIAGTVGESRPIIGLFIKIDDQSAQNYNVFYRAGNGDNQTKWHQNGEITDTFSWDKIETLEIYMEPKECTLVDNLKLLVKSIEKDKCALEDQNISMNKQQAVNEAQSIRINELTEKLENSEKKSEYLDSCIEKLGDDVEQYIQEIDELRTKYDQLEQSFSWRVTKPLRNIGLWWNKRRK